MRNWHCPIGFLINTAPLNVYFILNYHLFFRKDFFSDVYISVNTIFECSYLFFGWEIDHPLSTCATEGIEGVLQKCVLVHTGGGERSHASCVRTDLHHLFSCFYLIVSCFICRDVTLPSFKKGVFVRNVYFSQMRSISAVVK